MNRKNSLPVNNQIHRKCSCHQCADEKNEGTGHKPTVKSPFIKKIVSAGAVRFAGWWTIFAGALAVNSVCPVCGSQGCPVGIGTTGIIAALFAGIKQWGGAISVKLKHYIMKSPLNSKKEIIRGINMSENCKASDIIKGFHPDGYRIDKTASPIDFYTRWEITPEGKWINPKPATFHSIPQDGWFKTDSFE